MTLEDELFGACKDGDLKKVKYLVKGVGIHTGLCLAALRGHLEIVKYLVSKGANIHADNDWPLQLAANYGHLEIVKYLVSKGADIHADNDWALRLAVRYGHLEIVLYLRKVAGPKWKCHNCIVRATCVELCDDFRRKTG